MLLVFKKKATEKQIKQVSLDLDGYIKLVVDVEKNILTAGGERHFEGEQKLLRMGSRQNNLWGGGLDLETKEIDYNSIINLRPNQDNPSRDVLSIEIRQKFDKLVKGIFSLSQ